MLTVEFTMLGIACLEINDGPWQAYSMAFSFQAATTDQAETDKYWNAIIGNGGQASHCGWRKDKWGLSWQITPIALTQGYADPGLGVAKRVFEAMMHTGKIDISKIKAARAA